MPATVLGRGQRKPPLWGHADLAERAAVAQNERITRRQKDIDTVHDTSLCAAAWDAAWASRRVRMSHRPARKTALLLRMLADRGQDFLGHGAGTVSGSFPV